MLIVDVPSCYVKLCRGCTYSFVIGEWETDRIQNSTKRRGAALVRAVTTIRTSRWFFPFLSVVNGWLQQPAVLAVDYTAPAGCNRITVMNSSRPIPCDLLQLCIWLNCCPLLYHKANWNSDARVIRIVVTSAWPLEVYTSWKYSCSYIKVLKTKTSFVAWVREWAIPTVLSPLDGEVVSANVFG
jgi:hypothetical protein